MIKTLSEIVVQKVAGLTIGTNFFPGYRPIDAPVNCVSLYIRAQTLSYQVPNYTEGVFLFEIRSDNWYAGNNLAKSISAAINGMADCSRVMVENSQKRLNILSGTILEFESIGQDPNGATIHYVVTLLRFQEIPNG